VTHIRVPPRVKEKLQLLTQELGFKSMGETLEYILEFDDFIKKLEILRTKEKIEEINYKIEILQRKKAISEKKLESIESLKSNIDCLKRLKNCENQTIDKQSIANKLIAYFVYLFLKNNDPNLLEKIILNEADLSEIKKKYPWLPINKIALQILKENDFENKTIIDLI